MILSIPKTLWTAFQEQQQQHQEKQECSRTTLDLPKPMRPIFPALQLPLSIYFKNNAGEEFEGRIYDMEMPDGSKFIASLNPKQVKRPRARVFVRIIKVPEPYKAVLGMLFTNLSQAFANCQKTNRSTASGWMSWNVKFKDKLINISQFRVSESGKGFIPSKKWTSLIRQLLIHYAIPKNEKAQLGGFQQGELEALGVTHLQKVSLDLVCSYLDA